MSNDYVLGIDLGTGFSCMAIMEGGEATVINNREGLPTTPSIVAWTKNGERLVGQAAKRQAVTNAKNTVYEVKRLIGRKMSEVTEDIAKFPFKVEAGNNGECRIKVMSGSEEKSYTPEEISSTVLAKLKADAEAYLGQPVTKAVITVPAFFNNAQREATKVAGEIAGLEVLRIINEPTAAAMAFGADKEGAKYIAIADIGCGTTDFSILEIADGVYEVKATTGDSQLGGKDWDAVIMDWIISEFKKENGIDLSKDNMAVQRIKDEAEKCKIELSNVMSYEINLPFITADASGPKHINMTLTRSKFEQMTEHLRNRLVEPAKQCVSEAGLEKVDKVLLVGGSTRIPSVVTKIEEIFGLTADKNIDPDLAVAKGAAIQGGVLTGKVNDILLLDVTPLDISIETQGGIAVPMIARNSTIPCKKSDIFTTAADNQPAITVRICQGNRRMFNDNKLLGQFNLDGILPAPRGVPQEEITVDVNANGIITVTAKDVATGKDAHITISSSSGLSKEEIEKAKAEAEQFAEADKQKADLITERNQAEALCYSIEKTIKDNKDKIEDDELVKSVEEKIEAVRKVIPEGTIDEIKKAATELSDMATEIGKKIYQKLKPENGGTGTFNPSDPSFMENLKQAAAKAAQEKSGSGTQAQPETMDAEFVEVEPDK